MKKILLYCTLSAMLFACHKDNKPTPPPPNKGNKTYTVKFNVSATGSAKLNTNSLHGNDAAAVPVSTFANVLYYWVYNSTGNLVTQLTQTSASSNFGQITDTFSPGNYNIVIFAQNSPTDSAYITTPPSTFARGFVPINGMDSFFDNFPLTVTNTPVTEDVTLNRIVGQLQIVVTDTVPATAKQITANLNPYNYLKIANGTALDTVNSIYFTSYHLFTFPIPDSAKGKKNFTMTTYVVNPPTHPFSVTLAGYNASGAAIATAKIDTVTTQVNTRTILSGDLFLHEANIGFTIGYAAWGSTTVVPFSNQPSPITKTN